MVGRGSATISQRGRMVMTSLLLATSLSLLSACATATTNSRGGRATTPPVTSTPVAANRYVDTKLGFSLELPPSWTASSEPGLRASPQVSAVTLSDEELATHQQVVIGIFQSAGMPEAFALRGTPTTHIGPYPAFIDNRMRGVARDPCLVRIFLAGTDYVMATWCSADAAAAANEFEQLLATFRPAAPLFMPHAPPAPTPVDCTEVERQLGYGGVSTTWGRTLATSPSSGWRQLQPGISICSNDLSPDLYLFQCTELVNRFLYEEWALPHVPGSAARYFDYYQDGTLYPGVIRDFPAGTYQLSSDASQGRSAFRPEAGDLLIFQDVNNPAGGWTSGLTSSPGHIAIVTGTDATHVYIAQENYNDSQFFLALPLTAVADGWHITDLSGLSHRIVRGWIRLTVSL